MMNAGVPGWGAPATLFRRRTSVKPDVDGAGATAGGGTHETGEEVALTAAEHALLDAALAFYEAAESVIDFGGPARPRVRRDAAGFDAVRQAMAALEARVVGAHNAGVPPQRIAQVARIEQEMVTLILQRAGATPSREDD
jgi:hypothetical protein